MNIPHNSLNPDAFFNFSGSVHIVLSLAEFPKLICGSSETLFCSFYRIYHNDDEYHVYFTPRGIKL